MGAAPPMAPQFPSTDPQAILGLLSQLAATDQVAFIQAQEQAKVGAVAMMLQNQPDPMAAAAQTAPGQPAPPTLDQMNGGGGGAY